MLDIPQLKKIYNNEQIVLILLCRLYFGTCNKETVDCFIVGHAINWQKAMRLTRLHSIGSFIYTVINNHQINANEQFILKLKHHYIKVKIKNFRQIEFASTFINELKKKNIALIPYKGAFFAEAYYNDWAARESSDIDFLAAQKDLPAIEDHFIAHGYTAKTTVKRPYLKYYSTFFKDIVYTAPGINTSIEIHWRLMERFSGSYPGYRFFAPHLVTYQTGSFNTIKLKPTYDFLAVASNHFAKDMANKFKYLVDIACLINKQKANLDTAIILNCAQQYAFEKKLRTGLALVKQLLGVELIEQNYNLTAHELAIPLKTEVYLPRLYIDEPEFLKRSWQMHDNFLQKVKFALSCLLYVFLPTYADINKFTLPAIFLPVLIVLRPFRLLFGLLTRSLKKAKPS